MDSTPTSAPPCFPLPHTCEHSSESSSPPTLHPAKKKATLNPPCMRRGCIGNLRSLGEQMGGSWRKRHRTRGARTKSECPVEAKGKEEATLFTTTERLRNRKDQVPKKVVLWCTSIPTSHVSRAPCPCGACAHHLG